MDYEALINLHFSHANRRSEPYRRGVQAWLRRAHEGVRVASVAQKYEEGTVEFDAFFAGVDCARERWRNVLPNKNLAPLIPSQDACSNTDRT